MKKICIFFVFLATFAANSAFAWGNPFLTPQQNYKIYLNCVNTANNGTTSQKIKANWLCQRYFGISTLP